MTQDSGNLTARLVDALRLVDEAIVDAGARLAACADNPAVRRNSPGSNSFVISASEVFGRASWDVFVHDWLAQYKYARELLENRRFAALAQLIAGGGYYDSSHGLRRFAPEVIENIKAITGDLRAAVRLTDAKHSTTAGSSTAACGNPGLIDALPRRRMRR